MATSFFSVPRRYVPSVEVLTDSDTIFDKAVNAGSIILDMTMGKRCQYIRSSDGQTSFVWVSNGGLNWRNITAFGEATLEQTQQDFIISRTHKTYPFPFAEPEPGDKLVYPSGWGWELLKIDGQECWRPMGKSMVRVHCKRIK